MQDIEKNKKGGIERTIYESKTNKAQTIFFNWSAESVPIIQKRIEKKVLGSNELFEIRLSFYL